MFTITYDCGGRLGNCIFPFFVCILIEMRYGYIYTEQRLPNTTTITDELFAELFTEEKFLKNEIELPLTHLRLWGFFQYDWIFKHYRKELLEYVQKYPRILSIMDKESGNWLNSKDLLADSIPDTNPTPNDIVIHLRLEDNVTDEINLNGPRFVFDPDDYDPILKSLSYDTIYWVMKEPETDIEKKYIKYLLDKWGGVYRPQTLLQDVCLMRKAHRIICSRSTLSWASSYLTPHAEQVVYLPYKKVDWFYEQCPGIYPQTCMFDYKKLYKKDLEEKLKDVILS